MSDLPKCETLVTVWCLTSQSVKHSSLLDVWPPKVWNTRHFGRSRTLRTTGRSVFYSCCSKNGNGASDHNLSHLGQFSLFDWFLAPLSCENGALVSTRAPFSIFLIIFGSSLRTLRCDSVVLWTLCPLWGKWVHRVTVKTRIACAAAANSLK